MWNSAYTYKKIISTFIKTLQIKLSPLSAAKCFTLKIILHINCSTLKKRIFHCHYMLHINNEVKLFACCSLVVSTCSLLVTFCSLLVTCCSLLVSICSLLVTFNSLLVTFCSLLVTFCSLLATFCPLLDKKF